MTKMPEKWTFDAPYTASFNGSGADRWLGLKAHGMLVASYSVKEWGNEQACIEAAWRHAYDTPADLSPSPDVVKELVEALVEHNDLLRSAFEIAKREGVKGEIASTNWDAYYNRVAVVLKRHHQTANDARAIIAKAKGLQ